jgi:hypothetical protein
MNTLPKKNYLLKFDLINLEYSPLTANVLRSGNIDIIDENDVKIVTLNLDELNYFFDGELTLIDFSDKSWNYLQLPNEMRIKKSEIEAINIQIKKLCRSYQK